MPQSLGLSPRVVDAPSLIYKTSTGKEEEGRNPQQGLKVTVTALKLSHWKYDSTWCAKHWVTYGSVESLYCTLETNITLHVN